MIIVKTKKWDKIKKEYVYKNYEVVENLKTTMNKINKDRSNNDVNKYEPICIYDIIEN